MIVLVKRYPYNARKPEQNEVYPQSQWHDWIQPDGSPLTDENYGYALCERCPEGIPLDANDFAITETIKEVPSDEGDGEVKRVKSWIAYYVGRTEGK